MTHHSSDVDASIASAALAQPMRRRALLLGTAAVSTGIGLATAAWALRDRPADPNALPPAFWAAEWDAPMGGRVALKAFRDKPLLLNFWATWCGPCVQELPLINDFFRKNTANGWHVLGVAVDKQAAVQRFLQRTPLDFPVAIAGFAGSEFARALGNISGGLPFSVAIAADGRVLMRKLGAMQADDVAALAGLK